MSIARVIEKKSHEVSAQSMVFFAWLREKYPNGAPMKELEAKYPGRASRRTLQRYMKQIHLAGMVDVGGNHNYRIYTPKEI